MGFCCSSMLYMLDGGGGRGGGKSVNSYFNTGGTGELDSSINSVVDIFEGTNDSVKLSDRFVETFSVPLATPPFTTWKLCVNID